MISPARNAPCPCGSGKKYKHCCANKPVNYGPCAAPASPEGDRYNGEACGAPGCGAIGCRRCDHTYAHCHAHHADVNTMMRGHVLRCHPETIPNAIKRLVRNEEALAKVHAEAERHPEMWENLLDYIKRSGN